MRIEVIKLTDTKYKWVLYKGVEFHIVKMGVESTAYAATERAMLIMQRLGALK